MSEKSVPNSTPEKKRKPRKLTDQQEAFCQFYTTHWNATRAAVEAGYSEDTPHVRGYELRKNPLVKARIAELTDHAMEERGITRERILTELARIAFVNMKELASWNESGVRFKPSDEITDEAASAILEVSETVTQHGGTLKIKQHDKVKALELLGKYRKIFADRVEHSGPDGKPIEHKSLNELSEEQLDSRIAVLVAKT